MGRESSDVRNVFAKATSAIVTDYLIFFMSFLVDRCSFLYFKESGLLG